MESYEDEESLFSYYSSSSSSSYSSSYSIAYISSSKTSYSFYGNEMPFIKFDMCTISSGLAFSSRNNYSRRMFYSTLPINYESYGFFFFS